jgi:uncharacterized metal-binding protein
MLRSPRHEPDAGNPCFADVSSALAQVRRRAQSALALNGLLLCAHRTFDAAGMRIDRTLLGWSLPQLARGLRIASRDARQTIPASVELVIILYTEIVGGGFAQRRV